MIQIIKIMENRVVKPHVFCSDIEKIRHKELAKVAMLNVDSSVSRNIIRSPVGTFCGQ